MTTKKVDDPMVDLSSEATNTQNNRMAVFCFQMMCMFALPDDHTAVAKAFYGWETAGDIIDRSESGLDSAQRPTKWVHVGHSMGTGGIEKVSRTGTQK